MCVLNYDNLCKISYKLGSMLSYVVYIDTPVRTANAQAVFGAGNPVLSNCWTGAVVGRVAERKRAGVRIKSRGGEPAECFEVAPWDTSEWTEWRAFPASINVLGTWPTGAWPCRGRLSATGQGCWTCQACPAACGYFSHTTRHIIHIFYSNFTRFSYTIACVF